jgi:hypothetical protein
MVVLVSRMWVRAANVQAGVLTVVIVLLGWMRARELGWLVRELIRGDVGTRG